MEEDSGGVGRLREDEVEEGEPRPPSVEGNGPPEGDGELPLGAEGAPLDLGDAAGKRPVEAGFTNPGAGLGEKKGLQAVGPAGGGFGGMPGVETVGMAEFEAVGEGMVGEGGSRPVGFLGGEGVDADNAGIAGAAEDGVEMGGDAGIMEMRMGVGVRHGKKDSTVPGRRTVEDAICLFFAEYVRLFRNLVQVCERRKSGE